MRCALVLVVAVACSSPSASPNDAACPSDLAIGECSADQNGLACSYVEPSGLTSACACRAPFGGSAGELVWVCSDCPWSDPNQPQSCAQPGLSCYWSSADDEMECGCECSGSGMWSCVPETSNSVCPGEP